MASSAGKKYSDEELSKIVEQVVETGDRPRLDDYNLRHILAMGYESYLSLKEQLIIDSINNWRDQGRVVPPQVWLKDMLPLMLHPERKQDDLNRLNDLIWRDHEGERPKFASGITDSDITIQSKQAIELIKLGVIDPIESKEVLEQALQLGLSSSFYNLITPELQGEFFVPKAIDGIKASFLSDYEKTSIHGGHIEEYRFAHSWLGKILSNGEGIEASGRKDELLDAFLNGVKEIEEKNNGMIPFGSWKLFEDLLEKTFADPQGPYADILLDRDSQHPLMDFITKSGEATLSTLVARAMAENTLLAEHPDDIKLLDTTINRVRSLNKSNSIWQSGPSYSRNNVITEAMNIYGYGMRYREDLHSKFTTQSKYEARRRYQGASWEALPWSKPAIEHLIENPLTNRLKHPSARNGNLSLASMQTACGNYDTAWRVIRSEVDKGRDLFRGSMVAIANQTPSELLMTPENRPIITNIVKRYFSELQKDMASVALEGSKDQKAFDEKQRRYGTRYYDPADRPVISQAYLHAAIKVKGNEDALDSLAKSWVKMISIADFDQADIGGDQEAVVDLIMRSFGQPDHKIEEAVIDVQMAKERLNSQGLDQQTTKELEQGAAQPAVAQAQQAFNF